MTASQWHSRMEMWKWPRKMGLVSYYFIFKVHSQLVMHGDKQFRPQHSFSGFIRRRIFASTPALIVIQNKLQNIHIMIVLSLPYLFCCFYDFTYNNKTEQTQSFFKVSNYFKLLLSPFRLFWGQNSGGKRKLLYPFVFV